MRDGDEKAVSSDMSNLFSRVARLEDVKLWLKLALGRAVEILEECQKTLDRITLPKIMNDVADLEKRLRRLERGAGRDWIGRMQRAESRQSEFERRITDLEREAEVKRHE